MRTWSSVDVTLVLYLCHINANLTELINTGSSVLSGVNVGWLIRVLRPTNS